MRKTKLFLLVTILMTLFSALPVQAAAGADEQEIDAFIREAFQIVEAPDEKLSDYGLDEESQAVLQVLRDHGLEACRILETHSYSLDDSGWVVMITYEIEIREPDFLLPGMTSLYVTRDDQGILNIPSGWEDMPQDLEEKTRDIMEKPEIKKITEKIEQAYQQIIENDKDGEIELWLAETLYDTMAVASPASDAFADDCQDFLYTVSKGDCLWNIAKTYSGSGQEWRSLYEINSSVIGKDPSLIFPGQQLNLEF